MKLPRKLRAGDTLTADWLNSLADNISSISKALTRNKVLKGAGYSVSESSGGTSLTIAKQPEFLRNAYKLPLYINTDFALRIKPKELSEANAEGEWDMLLQVHTGSIRNSSAELILVNSYKDAPTNKSESIQPWDAEDWVDIQTIGSDPIEVFVCYDGSKAEFVSSKAEDSNIYVPIGVLEIEKLDEVPQYNLTQYHLGTIELGGEGKAMPFDVSIKLCKHECDVTGDEDFPQTPKYLINVEEGRVFFPEAKHATIPKKDGTIYSSPSALEAKNGFLLIEVYQKSDGSVEYLYRIAAELPGTALSATEKQAKA